MKRSGGHIARATPPVAAAKDVDIARDVAATATAVARISQAALVVKNT